MKRKITTEQKMQLLTIISVLTIFFIMLNVINDNGGIALASATVVAILVLCIGFNIKSTGTSDALITAALVAITAIGFATFIAAILDVITLINGATTAVATITLFALLFTILCIDSVSKDLRDSTSKINPKTTISFYLTQSLIIALPIFFNLGK